MVSIVWQCGDQQTKPASSLFALGSGQGTYQLIHLTNQVGKFAFCVLGSGQGTYPPNRKGMPIP